MSNYPPGVDDDDQHFTDCTEPTEEEEMAHYRSLDWFNHDVTELSGEPWPRDAAEAAQCTPITLWNRTLNYGQPGR